MGGRRTAETNAAKRLLKEKLDRAIREGGGMGGEVEPGKTRERDAGRQRGEKGGKVCELMGMRKRRRLGGREKGKEGGREEQKDDETKQSTGRQKIWWRKKQERGWIEG